MDSEEILVQAVRVRGHAGSSRRAMGAAAAMAGFLVLVIVKPWAPAAVPAPAPAASPGVADRPAGLTGTTGTVPPIGPQPVPVRPSGAAVAAAIRPHAGWGLRALVPDEPAIGRPPNALREVWTPVSGPGAPLDRQAWRPEGRGVLELATGDRPVIALGLTGPDLDIPLATRIWRLVPGAVPQLVVPESVPGDPGRPIWLPRDGTGASLDRWRPGTYRIDLLDGVAIRRLVIRIPGAVLDADGPLPLPVGEPDEAALATLQSAGAGRTGAALLHERGATALPGATSRAADERTSWIDPFDPGGPWPRPTRIVAAAPWGIAWFPEPQATVLGARVDMLAPIERRFTLVDDRIDLGEADPRDVVLLRWATGRPWPHGVYRIQAAWVRPDGSVGRAAWHLELVPARDRPLGTALVRLAHGWLRDPHSVANRVLGPDDVFDGGALARPANACGQRRLLEPSPTGIGLTGLGERQVDQLRVARLFENGYRIPLRSGLVPRAAEGLAIVASAGARWEPGAYRINVRFAEVDANGLRTATFLACVGSEDIDGSADGLRFDPATTVFIRGPGV